MKTVRAIFFCFLLLIFISLVNCAYFPPPPDGRFVPGPPPAAVAETRPVKPYPDAEWIDGYWAYYDGQWVWKGGHWERIPFAGAYWVPGYWLDYGARGWGWHPGDWKPSS